MQKSPCGGGFFIYFSALCSGLPQGGRCCGIYAVHPLGQAVFYVELVHFAAVPQLLYLHIRYLGQSGVIRCSHNAVIHRTEGKAGGNYIIFVFQLLKVQLCQGDTAHLALHQAIDKVVIGGI